MNLGTAGSVLVFLGLGMSAVSLADPFACPLPDSGETAKDCPWAGAARTLIEAAKTGQPIDVLFEKILPGVSKQIRTDATATGMLGSWGRSLNFDEYAKAMIVNPALLTTIYQTAGIPRPIEPGYTEWTGVQHAGLEHTYGYLFSLLRTSFGYKRARWVQGEIETGFDLPPGVLSPLTADGSLLANITYFAGRIAFARDRTGAEDSRELAAIELERDHAAKAVVDFDYSKLKRTRVLETVKVSAEQGEPREVRIRIDFVPFTSASTPTDPAVDSVLLVYSIVQPETGARLITAFPVARNFVTGVVAGPLGAAVPIITRYNAFVRGLTGATLTGSRDVLSP